MSILSRVKKAASSAISKAKSVISKVSSNLKSTNTVTKQIQNRSSSYAKSPTGLTNASTGKPMTGVKVSSAPAIKVGGSPSNPSIPGVKFVSKSSGGSSGGSSSSSVRQSTAPKVSSPTMSSPTLSRSASTFSSGLSGGVNSFSMPVSTPAMRTGAFTGAGNSLGTQQSQNPDQTDQSNRNVDLKNLSFPKTGQGTLPLSQILAGFQSGALTAPQGYTPTMPLPKVPTTIQSNQLGITPQDVLARRDQMAGGAGSLASMQASLENAQAMLDQYKAQQDMLNPPLEAPIEDTLEQMEWLDQFAPDEKINWQQEIDTFKEDIGLTQVTAQRIDVMKQLNATNEVYQKIIDDIKGNPELPTALAQRRMNEAYEQQKGIVLQLTGQFDVLTEQERIMNDQVNQKYQIMKDEYQMEQEKEKKLYDILNFMIDGGSISAMTDAELKAISDRLGVPLSALKDVRSQTLKERETEGQKTTIYSTDQGLVALTQDSMGNVIKSTTVLPKSESSSSSWEYSSSDLKNLTAGGMLGKPLQEQLDFLGYGKKEEDGPVNPFR